MKFLWSVFAAVALAQGTVGKGKVSTTQTTTTQTVVAPQVPPPAGKASIVPSAPVNATVAGKGKAAAAASSSAVPDLSNLQNLDAATEKKSIIAMQVQSSLEYQAEQNGGSVKGTVVDLVLQSLSQHVNATCTTTSKDFMTCATGYVSLDCVFQQAAASFGGVNCIPYLSQCATELVKFCQSKVPADQKCKSKTACDCAKEAGCGWSVGHLMCLTNRDPVSCGDCPTMSRCGKIDCPAATRPCDCAALGGLCGWSTSSWRCESGKDTDCNECAEQTECGGPGLSMANAGQCPSKTPKQLDACHEVMTCSYDKKCCPRCAGEKQVCAETQAECDGQTWELRAGNLVCPDCHDYYYDAAYYDEEVPSEPRNVTAVGITQNSANLIWLAPLTNFKIGIDGYSVAYAIDVDDSKVQILNTTTGTKVTLTGLVPNTQYKVSILPVVNATETVGEAGTVEFKTLASTTTAAAGKKKKGPGKTAKAGKTTPAGKVAPAPAAPAPAAKGKASG